MTATMKFRNACLVAAIVFVSAGPIFAQEPKSSPGLASTDPAVAELRALEQKVETATLHVDTAFLEKVYCSDFQFIHGSEAVLGISEIQNKTETIKALRPERFISRDLDSVEVEPHGDVAMTTGRIRVRSDGKSAPYHEDYTLYYVRVYVRRDGRWQLLIHRTVKEIFGPVS